MSLDEHGDFREDSNISLESYNLNLNSSLITIQSGLLDFMSALCSDNLRNSEQYTSLRDIFDELSYFDSCTDLLDLGQQLDTLLNLTIGLNSIENMLYELKGEDYPESLINFCESSINILMELTYENIILQLSEGTNCTQISYFSAINLLTKKLEDYNFWLVGHNVFDSEFLYEHGDFDQARFLFKRFGQIINILRGLSSRTATTVAAENYYKYLYRQMIGQLRPSLSEN